MGDYGAHMSHQYEDAQKTIARLKQELEEEKSKVAKAQQALAAQRTISVNMGITVINRGQDIDRLSYWLLACCQMMKKTRVRCDVFPNDPSWTDFDNVFNACVNLLDTTFHVDVRDLKPPTKETNVSTDNATNANG